MKAPRATAHCGCPGRPRDEDSRTRGGGRAEVTADLPANGTSRTPRRPERRTLEDARIGHRGPGRQVRQKRRFPDARRTCDMRNIGTRSRTLSLVAGSVCSAASAASTCRSAASTAVNASSLGLSTWSSPPTARPPVVQRLQSPTPSGRRPPEPRIRGRSIPRRPPPSRPRRPVRHRHRSRFLLALKPHRPPDCCDRVTRPPAIAGLPAL
jgi:hypothetical protein